MKPTVQIRDILRALGGAGEDARSRVIGAFKSSGGSVDRFQARADWHLMASAITSVEDFLERESRFSVRLSGPRLALRAIRRQLEDAVEDDARFAARAAASQAAA